MKKLIVLMTLLSMNNLFADCSKFIYHMNAYIFGEQVDVIYKDNITFLKDVNSTSDVSDFQVKIENYSGFECAVEKVKKLRSTCLLVEVSWSPGSDSSGCDVNLIKDEELLSTSELYMNY